MSKLHADHNVHYTNKTMAGNKIIHAVGNQVNTMNRTVAMNQDLANARVPVVTNIMTTVQSTPKQLLVQKLQGAIQNLRREREQEYREKVESEERLRLASEEQSSLATIVAGLKAKHENLTKRKTTVETNLVQLEADVKDLTEKVRFQHNELLGARAKIQQQTRAMDEAARVNQENLESIRQLAHERSLKTTALGEKRFHRSTSSVASTNYHDDDTVKLTMMQRRREGMERELSCMMFEWESFPKLMEEKSRIYSEETKFLAQLNESMTLELGRRGIEIPALPNSTGSSPATPTGDNEHCQQPRQVGETTL